MRAYYYFATYHKHLYVEVFDGQTWSELVIMTFDSSMFSPTVNTTHRGRGTVCDHVRGICLSLEILHPSDDSNAAFLAHRSDT